MFKALGWLAMLTALGGCAATTTPPSAVVTDLAPTGRLRAAINFGNPVLAQKDPATGEPCGISVDLARGAWDVAFLAIEPARAAQIAFTAPYVVIEGTYLVPVGSPLRTIADVDRDGVRIAVGNKSAYDLFLSRTLKHAQLVRAPTSPAAVELFVKEKLDAAAGVKQPLAEFVRANPNVRVMDGRFMAIEQAMGTPRGLDAGARYLREFVEEMKASGFVARALERSGQGDAAVAPPAPAR